MGQNFLFKGLGESTEKDNPVNPVMAEYHKDLQKALHSPFRKVPGMDTKKLTRV
jgi:hypothetical protein